MNEDKRPFSVKDRRHFTAEGDAREPVSPPPEDGAGIPSVPEAEPAAPPVEAGSNPEAPVEFAGFLLSLGAQALALLAGEGEGGKLSAADLQHARSLIAILEMLKDKSEGRRTPEEDRVLEGLLYELRMGYLARARAGGA